MPERPPQQEPAFLRERAASLRVMAAKAMPPSIAGQLLDVAAELDKRAARLEGLSRSDDEGRYGGADNQGADEGILDAPP
jgi:hypothetical protein